MAALIFVAAFATLAIPAPCRRPQPLWRSAVSCPSVPLDRTIIKEDTMVKPAVQTRETVSFGPFRLIESERLLIKEDACVELGARALDILIALVSRPNEIIG